MGVGAAHMPLQRARDGRVGGNSGIQVITAYLRLVLGEWMSIFLCAQLRSPVTMTGLPPASRP